MVTADDSLTGFRYQRRLSTVRRMAVSNRIIELDNRLAALETVVTRMEPVFRDMLKALTLINERIDTHAAAIKAITELIAAHQTEPIDK